MTPTHISNLYALAKGLRAAFLAQGPAKYVLQKNANLLTYYYYSMGKDWEKLAKPNPIHYQKIWLSMDYGPVEMKPNEQLPFGIAVLTWLPGQMTSIHGHPENGCVMMPLCGTLTEERFTILASLPNKYLPVQKNILIPGQTSFINNEIGFHRVRNNGNITAVSLHVYSPGPC